MYTASASWIKCEFKIGCSMPACVLERVLDMWENTVLSLDKPILFQVKSKHVAQSRIN